MANELRVRSIVPDGLIDDAPLTSGATVLTSSGLASVPVIGSTQHFPIILDPDGLEGNPEIVYVTAHTSLATTATILRAQEGTVAAAHAQDTPWVHGPTTYDFVGSSAKTTCSAAQNVTSTAAYVAWDAEEYDFDSYHDNVTNNTRLVVPTPGLYLVGFQLTHATQNFGRLLGIIHKNGVTVAGGSVEADGSAGQYPTIGTSVPVQCFTAGDYFQLQAVTVSTTLALNVAVSAFWIIRLSR